MRPQIGHDPFLAAHLLGVFCSPGSSGRQRTYWQVGPLPMGTLEFHIRDGLC